MNAEDRRLVLWLGDAPPSEFSEALVDRDCVLEVTDEAGLPSRWVGARALVIPFDGDVAEFRSRVRRTREEALDHGLTVCLCAMPNVGAIEFNRVTADVVGDFPRHRLAMLTDAWTKLAETIRRYNPGPGMGDQWHVDAQSPTLDSEDELLLRRAFSDFNEVAVRKLKPGYSGASVLVVHPLRPKERRLLPFVVKFGERDRIDGERLRYEQHIAGKIPFDQRPNIDGSRFVEGKTRALLVQDFVDAVALNELAQGGNPLLFLTSLFEGALRECRLHRGPVPGGINGELKRLEVIKWDAELADAGKQAKALFGASLSVDELIKRFDGLPKNDVACCTLHGDLHAGNVFVASASPHVILIDFGHSDFGPAALDPAALEVSLTFPPEDQPFSPELEQFLKGVYAPHLAVPAGRGPFGRDRWLWEAIRGIRGYARLIEPVTGAFDPYDIAVAAFLLRFAAYPINTPPRRRALAYWLAERLLT